MGAGAFPFPNPCSYQSEVKVNLKQLREYVTAHSDYRPANSEYRDFVNGAVNEAYFRLYMERPWTFRHVEAEAFLQSALNNAEATSDLARRGIPLSDPNGVGLFYRAGSRLVTFNAPVLRLGGFSEIPMTRWDWIGQDLVDRTGQVHKIQWIESGVDPANYPNTRVFVDTPFREAALAGVNPDYEWEIIPRRAFLPPTVAQVSSATLLDTPYRNASSPRQWNLDVVTHDYFRASRPPYDLDSGSSEPSYLVLDNFEQIPPASGWNIEITTPGGATLAVGFYELAWCFLGPGRAHGPLSEPTTVEITELGQAIQFIFAGPDGDPLGSYAIINESYAGGPRFQQSGGPYGPAGQSGMHQAAMPKGLFINTNVDPTTGERLGPPRWQSIPAGAFIPQADFTSGDYAIGFANQPYDATASGTIVNGGWLRSFAQTQTYRDCGGMIQAGSVYPYLSPGSGFDLAPAPNTDYDPIPPSPLAEGTVLEQKQLALTLGYWLKPEPLTLDTSVPAMPPEFHQIIADRALADVCMFGNDETKAQLYERRYTDGVARLTRRYVTEHGATYVRQGIQSGSRWDSVWTATVQSYLGRRS